MAVVGRYLDTTQAAEYCSVSRRTLEGWRRKGKGPVYLKVSPKMIKYTREDLDNFMALFRVQTIDAERQ